MNVSAAQKHLRVGTRTAASFRIVHCKTEWRASAPPGPEAPGEEKKQSGGIGSWSPGHEPSSLGTPRMREFVWRKRQSCSFLPCLCKTNCRDRLPLLLEVMILTASRMRTRSFTCTTGPERSDTFSPNQKLCHVPLSPSAPGPLSVPLRLPSRGQLPGIFSPHPTD